MNILDKIVAHKREEMLVRKLMVPVDEVVNSKYFDLPCISLKDKLCSQDSTGIIAEFKRRSPSKGFINQHADVVTITSDYTKYGASGLSVLTDNNFFGGSTEDLVEARINDIPILRKEFIIDPYQILMTKAIGADVILLIAAILTPKEVQQFAQSARSLGLEVLLEIHDKSELSHICEEIDMVGINNRNLKTFTVDINHSLELSKLIPEDKIKIAESGIDTPEMIKIFRGEGYKGFLIGEAFMKEADPGLAFNNFVKQIK
ncbi:MAG: indole-3-glycerol phosphate synthase TrpC [Ferruginibacter sp.]